MKALLKRRHAYVTTHKYRRLRRRVTSLGISLTILLAVSLVAAGIANAKRHAALDSTATPNNTATISQNAHVSLKKTAARSTASASTPPGTDQNHPQSSPDSPVSVACTPKPVNTALSDANVALQTVAAFDAVLCKGSITSSLIYTDMPQTNEEADKLVATMSSTLDSFAAAKIAPTVIVEPKDGKDKLDLASLQTSTTGSVFEYFLSSLKAKGVSDAEAGTWVFFPEPNVPEWTTVDPGVFVTNFSNFGMLFKEYFKTAKLGVLFDSSTYAANDYASTATHASLLSYVGNLPVGLVDSIGYQGFPWLSPAGSHDADNLDATDFLKPSLAQEAAQSLGINDIWLVTGAQQMAAAKRARILDSIAAQAAVLQKNGFSVTVNIFTQDTSAVTGGADWTYWPEGQAEGSGGAAVFSTFANTLYDQKTRLGVY